MDLLDQLLKITDQYSRGKVSSGDGERLRKFSEEIFNWSVSAESSIVDEVERKRLVSQAVALHNRVRNLPSELLEIKGYVRASVAWILSIFGEESTKQMISCLKLHYKASQDLMKLEKKLGHAVKSLLQVIDLWEKLNIDALEKGFSVTETEELVMYAFNSYLELSRLMASDIVNKTTVVYNSSVENIRSYLGKVLELILFIQSCDTSTQSALAFRVNLVESAVKIGCKLTCAHAHLRDAIHIFELGLSLCDVCERACKDISNIHGNAIHLAKYNMYISLAYSYQELAEFSKALDYIVMIENNIFGAKRGIDESKIAGQKQGALFAKFSILCKSNNFLLAYRTLESLFNIQTLPFDVALRMTVCLVQCASRVREEVSFQIMVKEIFKKLLVLFKSEKEVISAKVEYLKYLLSLHTAQCDNELFSITDNEGLLMLQDILGSDESCLNLPTFNDVTLNYISYTVSLIDRHCSFLKSVNMHERSLVWIDHLLNFVVKHPVNSIQTVSISSLWLMKVEILQQIDSSNINLIRSCATEAVKLQRNLSTLVKKFELGFTDNSRDAIEGLKVDLNNASMSDADMLTLLGSAFHHIGSHGEKDYFEEKISVLLLWLNQFERCGDRLDSKTFNVYSVIILIIQNFCTKYLIETREEVVVSADVDCKMDGLDVNFMGNPIESDIPAKKLCSSRIKLSSDYSHKSFHEIVVKSVVKLVNSTLKFRECSHLLTFNNCGENIFIISHMGVERSFLGCEIGEWISITVGMWNFGALFMNELVCKGFPNCLNCSKPDISVELQEMRMNTLNVLLLFIIMCEQITGDLIVQGVHESQQWLLLEKSRRVHVYQSIIFVVMLLVDMQVVPRFHSDDISHLSEMSSPIDFPLLLLAQDYLSYYEKEIQCSDQQHVIKLWWFMFILLMSKNKSTNKFVEYFSSEESKRSMLKTLNVTDILRLIQLLRSHRSVDVNSASYLLSLALQMCESELLVNSLVFPDYCGIFMELLQCSQTRQQALSTLMDFEEKISVSALTILHTRIEQVDAIVSISYNYGLSLMELGQYEFSEKFLAKSLSLMKYATEDFQAERKNSVEETYQMCLKISSDKICEKGFFEVVQCNDQQLKSAAVEYKDECLPNIFR